MLPDINLDNENFEDIAQDAKNRIHTLYPEWTDYNYHDPGITLIELFAWLKEIQQYKFNQVSDFHKLCFLELLGMKREHRRAAAAKIYIETKKWLYLPKKSRFYAQLAAFETINKRMLLPINIPCCIIEAEGSRKVIYIEKFKEKKHICEPIFTKRPAAGNIFYVSFDMPLPVETVVFLGINLYEDNVINRKPLEKGIPFKPLAKLLYEYFSGGKWKPLTVIDDGTAGFLFDGNISILLETAMEKINVCGIEGYYIRISLLECEYDIPPMLTGISLNMLELYQQETLVESNDILIHRIKGDSETILGYPVYNQEDINVSKDTWLSIYGDDMVMLKSNGGYYKAKFKKAVDYKRMKCTYKVHLDAGRQADEVRIISYAEKAANLINYKEADGLPGQRYELFDDQISFDGFEIMIQEDGIYYDWMRVEAFYNSSEEDKHYILDEEKSCIIFGDGIKGRIPKGLISIISYVRTLGSGGNIKPDTIKQYGSYNDNMDSGTAQLYIYHEAESTGGQDTEELIHVFERFRKDLMNVKVLMCAKDYEKAVLNMHGLLIESCRAVWESHKNQIMLIVKPKTNIDYGYNINIDSNSVNGINAINGINENNNHTAKLSNFGSRYTSNILHYLENKRMIGTKISVIYPEYKGIMLYAEIIADPYCQDADKAVKEAVFEYFKEQEKDFGGVLYYSRIYGMIDSLIEVIEIKSLLLMPLNLDIEKNIHGDLIFSAEQIPELAGFQLSIILL